MRSFLLDYFHQKALSLNMFNNLRKLLILLLCFAVFIHSGSKLIVFGSYLLNKDYIKEVLCINKEKASMDCEGKCHLKKELEKDNGQDKSNPKPFDVKTEFAGFKHNVADFSFSDFVNGVSHNTPYNFSFSSTPDFGIFHPPRT